MMITRKHHSTKKHKSNTHKRATSTKLVCPKCPIGLKSFQEEFSKKHFSKLSVAAKKKLFVKQLLSKFAPHSIKPENDFYSYINYQWLKNVSIEQQQKYIVQIDDFRLTQDKVYRELDEIMVNYIKTHHDKLAKNLKNFRKSVLDMNPKSY